MLKFTRGDIFESGCEALVNPVNCVGVMGKGLALAFRSRYHDNFIEYKEACSRKQLCIGCMFVTRPPSEDPRYIINFPTKYHWNNPSEIDYIAAGLESLASVCDCFSIKTVALPALGCGCGQLDWNLIKPLLIERLDPLEETVFYAYEPY